MPRKATKKATKRHAKSAQVQLKKVRPNVEKKCSFWELPTLLRAPILKKLDAVSVTRMRRTSKAMNGLVENEDLRAPSDHKLVIKIDLDLERYVLSFQTTQGHFDIKADMTDLEPFDSEDVYEAGTFTKIKNPQMKLAGIHFKFIMVDFVRPYDESTQGYWRVFEKKAVPILEKLRLTCDALLFHDTGDADMSPVLPLIKFSSLKFEECTVDTKKMNWTIENGNVLAIGTLESQDITPAFGAITQFKNVTICIYDHDNAVKEVIKAIRQLPLGKLEFLKLQNGENVHVHDDSSDEEEEDDDLADEEDEAQDEPEDEKKDEEAEEKPLEEGEDSDEREQENKPNMHCDDNDLCDPRNISVLPTVRTLRSRESNGRPACMKFYKMKISNGCYAIITKSIFDVFYGTKTINFNFYIFAEYSRKNLFEAFFHEYFECKKIEDVLLCPHYHDFLDEETDEEAINKACEDYMKFREWMNEENAKSEEASKVSKE